VEVGEVGVEVEVEVEVETIFREEKSQVPCPATSSYDLFQKL